MSNQQEEVFSLMTIREICKLRLQWDSVSPRPEWQSLRKQMTADAREDVDRSELF